MRMLIFECASMQMLVSVLVYQCLSPFFPVSNPISVTRKERKKEMIQYFCFKNVTCIILCNVGISDEVL